MSAQEWMMRPDIPAVHKRNDACERIECVPVVVLDPSEIPHWGEFASTPAAALREIADNVRDIGGGDLDATEALVRWFADQIDPTPPRPEEPTGRGAVVACEYDGRKGYGVSINPGQWVFRGDHFTDHSPHYEDFENVRVLSEGVADDA